MEYIVKYNRPALPAGYAAEILNENYATMEIEPELAWDLLHNPEISYAEPAEKVFLSLLYPVDTDVPVLAAQRRERTVLRGSGVIVGIIDSGIDVTHPAFRTSDDRSRILSVWDMTQEGIPPAGFHQGHLIRREEIENGTAQTQDTIGHGTSVAGVAAGRDGVAPGASLIAVKLGETSSRTTDIMRGIKYVIDEAQRLDMPCAINLSYGTNSGSHRGQSLFEDYLNEMSQHWRNVIVCGSGNEGAGGHHFHGELCTGQQVSADFSVATDTSSLHLVLSCDFADEISYEIILPNGRSTGRIDLTVFRTQYMVDNTIIHIYNREPTHYSAGQEVYFHLQSSSGLPVGHWALICYGKNITSGNFDIWLPTLEEVGSRTAFLEPSIQMTATLPSTAGRVLAVGGYRPGTDTLSVFSGRGEVVPGKKVLPDLVAPAEYIRAPRSGGGYDSFSGTSMAAPFVTGTAALMMEWGIVKGNDPFLYGQRVRAFLHKNADRSSFLTYPNPLWGYGKLDIAATISDVMMKAQKRSIR